MTLDRKQESRDAAKVALHKVHGISDTAIKVAVDRVDDAVFRLGVNFAMGNSGRDFADIHFQNALKTVEALALIRQEQEVGAVGPDDDGGARQWQLDLETTARCIRQIGEHYLILSRNLRTNGMQRKTSGSPWLKAFYAELFTIYCEATGEDPGHVSISRNQGPRTHPMNFIMAVAEAAMPDRVPTIDRIYSAIRPNGKTVQTSM